MKSRLFQLFSFLFFLFGFVPFFLSPPTFAAAETTSWYYQTSNQFGKMLNDDIKQQNYTVLNTSSSLNSWICILRGCTDKPGHVFNYQNSTLAQLGSTMAFFYTSPPANLALFFQDSGESLGLIPKSTYAQGTGYNGLRPLLTAWKGFRNMAYAIIAFFMIVIGFMVMFRKKIDPKTVVTVQNALPRLVITLLLITFSYAIVGFLIDIMYLVIYLSIFIISVSFPNVDNAATLQSNYVNGGMGYLFLNVFAPLVKNSVIANTFGFAIDSIKAGGLENIAKGLLTLGAVLNPIGFALGAVPDLLLCLAFLFIFIRIVFILLTSYVNILMALLFGPLQILSDALPGGTGFSNWIRTLISNLIVYPVVIIMLILAWYIPDLVKSNNLWQPPLLLQPLGASAGLALALLSLGIALTIPSVVKSIKEMLKAKEAISSGPGAVFAPIGGSIQTLLSTGSQFYQGSQVATMAGQFFKRKT